MLDTSVICITTHLVNSDECSDTCTKYSLLISFLTCPAEATNTLTKLTTAATSHIATRTTVCLGRGPSRIGIAFRFCQQAGMEELRHI